MLIECKGCGRYALDQPCYECLKQERDKLQGMVSKDMTELTIEAAQYKQLKELAVKACPVCRETCAVRMKKK